MSNSVTAVAITDEWRLLSDIDNSPRKVGGEMGKHDFLMLLSAQLRYQDPLEPMKDSDFAAQLAQFSALEQMENMNKTLEAMSNYQAYSLVGKLVVARAYVDGVLSDIFDTVECVFTKDGVTYAQVGIYEVPISAIVEVYDNSNMLTPQMLIETSSNLIGRTVKAQVGDKLYEGLVTGVFVDDAKLWARIADEETGEEVSVQVGCIFDIRQTDAAEDGTGKKTVLTLDEMLIEAHYKYFQMDVNAHIGDRLITGRVIDVFIDENDNNIIKVTVADENDIEWSIPISDIDEVWDPEIGYQNNNGATADQDLADALEAYQGMAISVLFGDETVEGEIANVIRDENDDLLYAVVTDAVGDDWHIPLSIIAEALQPQP